jgi:hypothetical protein
MPTPRLTNEIIAAAIDGYEFQKTRIDAEIAKLRAMLPGGPAESAAVPKLAKRQRRKMSAAARARIAEAQRKRWAASKVQAEVATPKPAKTKRRISKAGLARIIAATKERWAKVRAAKAQQEKAAAKKTATKKAAKKTAAAAPAVAQTAD